MVEYAPDRRSVWKRSLDIVYPEISYNLDKMFVRMLSCWRCLSVGTICFGSHRNANRTTLFTKYFCQNTLHHRSNILFRQLQWRQEIHRGEVGFRQVAKSIDTYFCARQLCGKCFHRIENSHEWERGLKGFPRGSKVSQEVSTIQSVPRSVHHHTECPEKFTISSSRLTTLLQYIGQINGIMD